MYIFIVPARPQESCDFGLVFAVKILVLYLFCKTRLLKSRPILLTLPPKMCELKWKKIHSKRFYGFFFFFFLSVTFLFTAHILSFSGFAVCFIFVWHLTFFSACMAIAGYAEFNNRHSITCLKVKPVSMSGN